jgi:iron complex outermembrane receptor protein
MPAAQKRLRHILPGVSNLKRIHLGALPLLLSGALGLSAGIGAQEPDNALPEVTTVLIQTSAIPGNTIDIDKVPGNVQTLYAADLTRDGSASLTGAMNSRLGSVSINDSLADPFQPNIIYRGFEASPVLGTPQGLAVYQNGVRINEAFGDTVDWDLFPDAAIERVELVSASSIYGLNALGGAISITMKNGFSDPGTEAEASGGSFGRRSAIVQYGANSGAFGFYVAGRAFDASGWRLFSSDALRQLYAVLSARGDAGTLDLAYTGADNQLHGQGAAPLQELAISRSLVFTGPQANDNRLNFLTLNGTLNLGAGWSAQSLLYYRQFQQNVSNGNTTDYTACIAPGQTAYLCQSDQLTSLTDAAGTPLPDISEGGTLRIGENDSESIDTYGRGLALQIGNAHAWAGHANHFTAGAVLDYAQADFLTGTQIGLINSQLLVLPSRLIVDTTEAEQNAALAAGDETINATPVSLHAINKDVGVYATDTLDLSGALALTGSGRYNVANIDLHDQLGSNLSGSNRYSHVNPALGATYKLSAAATVYAGFSENTRTPTASEIECSNPLQPCLLPSNLAGDPPTLRQVRSQSTEFGVRGKWPEPAGSGAELGWNLGAFRTQLRDDIYGIATSLSSGFFQNIGNTRRQGLEAALTYQAVRWSAFANYSYIEATFESALTVPSPSNPFQDGNGNIQVVPGDRLPGIPRHRLKLGADYRLWAALNVAAELNVISPQYYFGDEANQLSPMPGYQVLNLHALYQLRRQIELFATVDNLLNAKYSTYGILSDPTGIGVPGIPASGYTNGPGVNNRFQSPAAPLAIFAGIRIQLN